ncbi:prepilin-type N-terminal cleavage/methylation domain-containing protein [Candidatus Dojkabacteria bacterium]|nr:prepilin-type N-terminal cleavage/methylation domain-containing protein [Candidatus Dojkabacteria bacterium]
MVKEFKNKIRSLQKAKRLELQAFTLLELLLVIAIIAVLAGIIMFALKPADRLREANQTKYLSNANDLEKAVNSYVVDNGGNLPTAFNSLTYGYYDICRQGQSGSCVSLDELVTSGKMSSIPVDSDNQTSTTTGFKVRYDPVKKEAIVYSNAEYLSVSASGVTLTSGLNGYWKLDDLSGPSIDSALNGNNGTWAGNTVAVVGKFGNATDFDGAGDYISIGTPSSLNLNIMTVSAWVKTSAGSVSFANSTVAGNYSQYFLSLGDYSTSTPRVTGYVRTNGLVWKYIKGNTPINDNQWHHVSMTYDGQYVKVYLDGVLDATPLSVTELLSTAGTFLIGSYDPSNNTDASIDEVRVYNRALNSTEILALYKYAPPPVAHWRFDETSGVVAYDSSGNNHNATLVNGPIWSSGKLGGALGFDGANDYVINSDTELKSIGGGAGITYTVWFKTSDPNTSTTYPNLLGIRKNTVPYDIFNLRLFQGNLAAEIYDMDNNVTSGGITYNNSVVDDKWYHAALVKDGNTAYLYVDGVQRGTVSRSWGPITNTEFLIGSRSTISAGVFNGLLDDVRVYNYARTPEQILKDMNNL